MNTSEKFCLKWNDFQENLNTAFGALRKDIDFTDVTLACEDGHQVEAHKVILTASSPFFQKMLRKNKHTNPLIYMRGMKSEDLVAIVDFLYYGETDIQQDNLENFLKIAEELDLKGLNQTQIEDSEETQKKPNTIPKRTHPNQNNLNTSQLGYNFVSSLDEGQIDTDTTVALHKEEFTGDMKDLDNKIKTLMSRGENMIKKGNGMIKAYVCQVCGKEGESMNIKSHIEAHHLERISIPCNLCGKPFRSRNTLSKHNFHNHKQNN